MLATLVGKNTIYKINLPQTTIGNYWISDKSEEIEKKLINIEGTNGNWQITSNNYMKIINSKCISISQSDIKIKPDNEKIMNKIILKEYSIHFLYLENYQDLFILYCSPSYEKDFLHLDIKNTKEILIGNGLHNHISYNNPLVNRTHTRISFDNGKWMIENFDLKFGTFVNNIPISTKRTVLHNGDVIFIMGLKLILIGNSIFMNPLQVIYNKNNLVLNETKYDRINTQDAEDGEIELYTKDDYFSRAPRIANIIECEKVKIDPPPQIQNKEEMPAFLVLGSTISMGAVMMISMFSSMSGLLNGTATFKDTAPSFIMAFVMMISMILFPILTHKYEKRQKIRYEENRHKKYIKYLNSRIMVINEIIEKQKSTLYNNYLSAKECQNIILSKSHRLWERKIEDHDFLTLRLGRGNVPLNIDIQYPEEQFTMDDDNLVEILGGIAKEAKKLDDVPITLSLVEKNISALVEADNKEMYQYIQNLIMQLIAFQSYEDLKLVFLVKEDKEKKWEYLKMLPHVWNNTKQIRFFADDYNDMREISKYLEEELQNRMQYEADGIDYKMFSPYYLIITDDYKMIENLKIITDILKMKSNLGFSLLCMNHNLTQLPNECKTFININGALGMLFDNKISLSSDKKSHIQFSFEASENFQFEEVARNLANIPIKYTSSSEILLPNNYTFLEMYDAGRIEQLNILEKWNKNDSTLSLKAPIGIDSTGMPIILDIHEKFHGPHGLIAGSTGSGKSEFIITYILSLAINYHPDDVTFLLIDYKGGGLAGAFMKKDSRLPHLVGTITNIDTVGLQRSLSSIQSELRRRQIVFNEARDKTDESTIDIYKYQKLYHEGIVDEPIPHLLIICDEFAELKQQQEDFMEELMSVSRIGRSLGVHLILATQKPAGIVNDQIRSNSKFGICLKVQAREDSMDIIQRPDAANLRNAGQFYIQVGNNEYFALGQSGWSGAPYFPSDTIKKKLDTSIEFIANIGTIIKKLDNSSQKVVSSQGDQLTNIVKYMYNLAKQENIKSNQLWLDTIPETIYIQDLRKKYHIKEKENIISPVIGEYDDPFNQRQGIVNLNLSNGGNTVVFGNADSGKETLLSTVVYDIMTTHTAEEVQLYLLDFGSEALKIFKESPNVGDVVFINDVEKLSRLFDMLQKEIRDRKSILSEYNGDYNLYLQKSEESMPMLVIIINNYEAFSENYEDDYEDTLQMLTREGIKCGITFLITANTHNDIRYRLAQNFKQTIALQLNNEDDYYNIFEKVGKKRPSPIFGRGLLDIIDGEIYEFQTAKICEPENWNLHIKETNENLKEKNKTMAKPIPVLPNKVTWEDVENSFTDLTTVPIGIAKKSLTAFTYDFTKNLIHIITSKNVEDSIEFTLHILEGLKQLKEIEINIIDAERALQAKKIDLSDTYNHLVSKIEKNAKNSKYSLCIIIGIDKFLNEIEEDEFAEMLKKAEETEKYSFLLVENATRLKNHEYDEWYKDYLMGDTGIWVGNGIDDQYLLNVDSNGKDIVNNCGISFGYAVKQGEPIFIKLLGMKESGDDDE